MIQNRFKIFSLIIFLLFSVQLFANRNPIVRYIGIEQGLSNNSVRTICQDKNGFIWFGTYDGLNRYDGYEFKVFRNKINNSSSLTENVITYIDVDIKNKIWVGTRHGLSVFDNLSDKFSQVYYSEYNKTNQLILTDVIRAIKADINNNIFIGGEANGLLFCKNGTTKAQSIPILINGKKSSSYNVLNVKIGQDNRVWALVRNHGLFLFDYATMQLQLFDPLLKDAQQMEIDKDNFWYSVNKTLYNYTIQTKKVINSFQLTEGGINTGIVTSLMMDSKHQLWIGATGGITVYNVVTKITDYFLEGDGKRSLSSGVVYQIFEDKDSKIWVGTLHGGINLINTKEKRFENYSYDATKQNGLKGNFMASFCEDNNNKVWIGTEGSGINLWNRTTNTFENFKNIPNDEQSLSGNFIVSIKKDYLGNLWLASYYTGINRYDKNTGKFKRYHCINQTTGLENLVVFHIYEDRNKDLWVSALRKGSFMGALYRYNRKLDKFELFDDTLSDIYAFTEDKNNDLWGGTLTHLVKIDRIHKKHEFYYIGNTVKTIYEDALHNFWIGTEGGGLLLFDRVQKRIATRYTTDSGLCNNAVFNIIDDGKGSLWMGTYNGLARLNLKERTFKNYYQSDGLQTSQFNYNSFLALSTGEYIFGGIHGFSIFRPEEITMLNTAPNLQLTGININNVPIENNAEYIKKSDASDTLFELNVPYDKAIFSFNFAALEFSAPNKINYSYYMEGWDKGWNNSFNLRNASYTHLSEGNYIFRVRCTNADGIWGNKDIAIKIRVLPPWFRTWWAYLFYLSLISWLIYLYLNYRARQTKLEYEIKISLLEAERKKAEYEKEVAEHENDKVRYEKEKLINEKDKEMNEKRISFFTNISHEFRTPLTLIINPIKELIEENETKNEHKSLKIIYRNAKRMLSLVDQLLLFRKADVNADQMRISKLNFTDLCNEVFLCFIQIAEKKQIDYFFNHTGSDIYVWGDKEKLEIVLYNLISNAMKYTPEKGEIMLAILETEHRIEITVSDNGSGIPEDIGEKLFDKFYQVTGAKAIQQPGFGIGLFLVKHFTEAHKGEITYTSKSEKGTVFKLSLLKGFEHFGSEQVIVQEEVANQTKIPNNAFIELSNESVHEDNNQTENEEARIYNSMISNKKTLLIVDDELEMREYIVSLFNKDYHIIEAQSGEDGSKLARKHDPDLIISDIKMQGMSGIDFCRYIKENDETSYIPLILLTGTSSPELKLQGVEYGADDYITKPFDKELLVARVASLLKNRNNLRTYFYNEITFNKNEKKISEEYKEFLEQCIAIVESHLEDKQFTVKSLENEIGMSHSKLFRKVKIVSGQSINVFIRFIRLRKAAELFINTELNVNETAAQVGMNDARHFREQFHKLFGLNPSDYIKKYRKVFSKQYNKIE